MRLFFILILFLSPFGFHVQAQSATQTVQRVKNFIHDSLHQDTARFYEIKKDSAGHSVANGVDSVFYYVYVSKRDKVAKVLNGDYAFFNHNAVSAHRFADSLQKAGYDVLVYHTAGNSAAKLTRRMMEYPATSLGFIVLHESIHVHRSRSKSKLPYIFEEALCDLTANLFLEQAIQAPVAAYVKKHEAIYEVINKTLAGKLDTATCRKTVLELCKNADEFFQDRYVYAVNNAYLLRFRSYTQYYFLLKALYIKTNNRDLFYQRIFALKGSEKQVVKQLNKWLRN